MYPHKACIIIYHYHSWKVKGETLQAVVATPHDEGKGHPPHTFSVARENGHFVPGAPFVFHV
jgi:hypothetical protein